jgi:hypothetical protein
MRCQSKAQGGHFLVVVHGGFGDFVVRGSDLEWWREYIILSWSEYN